MNYLARIKQIEEYAGENEILMLGFDYDSYNCSLTTFLLKNDIVYALGNYLDSEDGYFIKQVNTSSNVLYEIINDWYNKPQTLLEINKMTEMECLACLK